MRIAAEIVSYLSLILLVAAPVLFYTGQATLELSKTLMLAATVVWFVSAPCWTGRERRT